MTSQPHPPEAFLAGMLASRQMDENAAYLRRGRKHACSSSSELNRRWVREFRRWFRALPDADCTPLSDLGAELILRGLQLPFDSVRRELDAGHRQMLQRDPDAEQLMQELAEFRDTIRQAQG